MVCRFLGLTAFALLGWNCNPSQGLVFCYNVSAGCDLPSSGILLDSLANDKLAYLSVALMVTSMALHTDGARVLALFGAPLRSHIISYTALTKELAARGHQLTVISSFPQEKPIANYTDIAVPLNTFGLEPKDMYDISMIDMVISLRSLGTTICEHFLEQPGVQKLIHEKDQRFDLVLNGLMTTDCLLGFAHKYNAPVISMAPMGGLNSMLETVGNPNPYAYIPNPILSYSDHMTFPQRLLNTILLLGNKFLNALVVLPQQDAAMRKYFKDYEPIPHISELQSKTALLMLNNHVSINYPRPFLPNVIEVGGMHIKPSTELPKDLQKYLDESTDGVIYFSMGSYLQTSKMSQSKRDAFVTAFSKLKQRVLWKSDEENVPGLSANVRLGKWLPQIAILAHPNVQTFITHGGLLSTQEAVYHSVPIVGIPIFSDQTLNMKKTELSGIGLRLSYENVTSESLQWALDTVLKNPSYRENAQRLSALFRDQPRTPLEQAVFWAEYVIRHKGALHLRSAALDLAWYQYFLLDVIAVLAIAIGTVLLVTYLIIKAIAKSICKAISKKKTIQDQKEKKRK